MLMFAEVLKKARDEQNISLYELARRTGYTLTALSNYEKGRRIPKLDAACKICEVLGLEIVVNERK